MSLVHLHNEVCPEHCSQPQQPLRIVKTVPQDITGTVKMTSRKSSLLLFRALCHFSVVSSRIAPTPGSNLSLPTLSDKDYMFE